MIPENQKFITELTDAFNRNMKNVLTPEIGVSLLRMVQEHLGTLEERLEKMPMMKEAIV